MLSDTPVAPVGLSAGAHSARQLVWLDDGHVLLVAQSAPAPGQEDAARQDSCDRLKVVDLATGNIQSGEIPFDILLACTYLGAFV